MSLAGFQTLEVELPTVKLYGIATGDGPLALFFHGVSATAYVFLPLMKALAQDFRCVAFDQRGHGRSGKPAAGYAATDFASDIALIVHRLKAGRAMIVGHALGGRNALVAGCEYEHFVSSAVAIEFTPFIEPEVFDELARRVAKGDAAFADLAATKTYLAERYARLPPEAIERRAEHGFAPATGGLRPLADAAAIAAAVDGLRADLAPYLDGIRVPTMLIRGKDSQFVSAEAWRKSRALRPDVRAVELDSADHYVPEEVPQALATEILAFRSSMRQ